MRGGVFWEMNSTCVQSGLPRPLGGYQENVVMEAHSPAPTWQFHHRVLPKQEPVEEDRNDSGINSGSDFHSSSPGSENSQDYHLHVPYQTPQNDPTISSYYSTPLIPRIPVSANFTGNTPLHLGFNPLTPPNSEPMASPKLTAPTNMKEDSNDRSTTPTNQPLLHVNAKTPQSEAGDGENEDHLSRLQMTLEKNGLLPPVSPKTSEHSMDDDNKSDFEGEEYDEQGLRIPKVNSHGKVKTFKCKQCDFVAITKLDFWEHSKGHIKADKLLTCPKCPFVTEYKHHLEYHLRNHFGSKPFKCDKCNYSCVNKSMLNSHMKSHSNVYQYRCSDCSYATKYCHSLKLHLRKYNHKPAMVLNPDGSPNPLPIIDVYGTRRGPKLKQGKTEEPDVPPQMLSNPFAQLMMNTPPQMQLPFPYPFLGNFPGVLSNPLLFPPGFENLVRQQAMSLDQKQQAEEAAQDNSDDESLPEVEQTPGVLDLSKQDSPAAEQPSAKNRRKGPAFKLERLAQSSSDEEEDDEEEPTTTNTTVEEKTENVEQDGESEVTNNNKPGNFNCQYCSIAFGDIVLYTMHMGYHGYKDPFTCNMCGEQCNDKVSFFLHIARTSHS